MGLEDRDYMIERRAGQRRGGTGAAPSRLGPKRRVAGGRSTKGWVVAVALLLALALLVPLFILR